MNDQEKNEVVKIIMVLKNQGKSEADIRELLYVSGFTLEDFDEIIEHINVSSTDSKLNQLKKNINQVKTNQKNINIKDIEKLHSTGKPIFSFFKTPLISSIKNLISNNSTSKPNTVNTIPSSSRPLKSGVVSSRPFKKNVKLTKPLRSGVVYKRPFKAIPPQPENSNSKPTLSPVMSSTKLLSKKNLIKLFMLPVGVVVTIFVLFTKTVLSASKKFTKLIMSRKSPLVNKNESRTESLVNKVKLKQPPATSLGDLNKPVWKTRPQISTFSIVAVFVFAIIFFSINNFDFLNVPTSISGKILLPGFSDDNVNAEDVDLIVSKRISSASNTDLTNLNIESTVPESLDIFNSESNTDNKTQVLLEQKKGFVPQIAVLNESIVSVPVKSRKLGLSLLSSPKDCDSTENFKFEFQNFGSIPVKVTEIEFIIDGETIRPWIQAKSINLVDGDIFNVGFAECVVGKTLEINIGDKEVFYTNYVGF